MDCSTKLKVFLTDEELQFPAIDELCEKYIDWLHLSKQSKGRKTRSANRKADQLFDEIMAFEVQPIKINEESPIKIAPSMASANSSVDSDSNCSSRPITRSLRSRSKTPTGPAPRPLTSPSTPANQRIRSHMKQQPASGGSSGNSSNVLSAALNQQHPSVSVTKIRQLLRADSAQKKREEERERQERLRSDRKAKEERAEAQKRQLLEERALAAKNKREQRLMHAAEVRKAREETRQQQKLRDEAKKAEIQRQQQHQQIPPLQQQQQSTRTQVQTQELESQPNEPLQQQHVPVTQDEKKIPSHKDKNDKPQQSGADPKQVQNLNETFKKPSVTVTNIDISMHDETTEDQKDKVRPTASWARAPHLREALIKQFSKSEEERLREVLKIFPTVTLPVDLKRIFGSDTAAGTKTYCRTSSAVWSPPNRPIKRTSSMVLTPSGEKH